MDKEYKCIKAHCGVCYKIHPCVKTDAFKRLSSEEKTKAILLDELIEPSSTTGSGVYPCSKEEMERFARLGDKIFS